MWFDAPREIQGVLSGPTAEFTMDFSLTSAGHKGGYDASDKTPPMPFAFGSLGLYRLGQNYLLSDSETGLSISFGDPTKSTRVTIIQSNSPRALESYDIAEGNSGLILLVDGIPGGFHGKPSTVESYVIGRGFQKRYWRGDLDYFDFMGRASTSITGRRSSRLLGAKDLLKAGTPSGWPKD